MQVDKQKQEDETIARGEYAPDETTRQRWPLRVPYASGPSNMRFQS